MLSVTVGLCPGGCESGRRAVSVESMGVRGNGLDDIFNVGLGYGALRALSRNGSFERSIRRRCPIVCKWNRRIDWRTSVSFVCR